MKYIILFSLVCWTMLSVNAQNDFEDGFTGLKFQSEKELFDYAFQNTDLQTQTTGLLLDYCEYPDSTWNVLSTIANYPIANSAFCYQVAGIINQIGLSQNYNDDSLIYPFLEHISSLDYVRKVRIPILLYDLKISQSNPTTRSTIETWNSTAPFPAFSASGFVQKDFFFAATMTDSIPYPNAVLHFDPTKMRSNKGRELREIQITVGGNTYYLKPGDELNLSQFSGKNSYTFTYLFNDGTSEIVEQEINMAWTPTALPKSGFWDFTYPENQTEITLDGNYSNIGVNNPSLKFGIKYGCTEGVIKKPYFLVAGWGPFTDKPNINDALGWPTTMYDIAQSMNQAGFIENLHAVGYDVIMVQFFPPNSAIQNNSQLLEMLINHINQQKYANDSYEENIIQGVSAGALCIKYTLLKMEEKHLEQNAPHPHTKLFVSFDGEHQGANIPLGLQHQVIFLDLFRHSNNIVWFGNIEMSPGATMYALRYILDAPLSKQLLHYFYTETGGNYNPPGQGSHTMRDWYLNEQTSFNHALNSHIPSYPSFGRNISISNGSSTPNYNFSNYLSLHPPYPFETNSMIYYQMGPALKVESHFLTHGISKPFYFGRKIFPWQNNWGLVYEALTKDPLILDNAPGGIIFIESNPLVAANKVMNFQLHGQPLIENMSLFSFTPTVLTHDIKNFDAFADGKQGYMDYNFKEKDLNYDHENAVGNPADASNTIGYPHLGYPSNHYDITPFDALFTWDQNTVHVTSGVRSDAYDSDDYYYEVDSPARNIIKNIVVEEGEHWNIHLQNKRIGYYSNGEIYQVDYNAENEIYWGERVTQKTDFLPVSIEPNAVVRAYACNGHVIKDGFEIKAGADVHIKPECNTCQPLGGRTENPTIDESNQAINESTVNTERIATPRMVLYPNPTAHELTIVLENEVAKENFDFFVYNFSGTLAHSGSNVEGNKIDLNLSSGMYLVKVKTEERWYTEKLIIK